MTNRNVDVLHEPFGSLPEREPTKYEQKLDKAFEELDEPLSESKRLRKVVLIQKLIIQQQEEFARNTDTTAS